MKQYLMKEEKNLLKCLKENYNCTTIYFDNNSSLWNVLSEGQNGLFTRATFEEYTFTLNRLVILNIKKLLEEDE